MGAPKTTDGRPRLASEKSDKTKVTLYSHDWTDPTTWRTSAVRVVNEVAEDSGDHTTYDLANPNVIDTYHGKISQEDFLRDANGNSYRVAVTVDDVAVVEQDPHFGTGGDFTVNYEEGKIVFLSAQAEDAEVKVTYHHATNSLFVIAPKPGTRLNIDFAECQFSGDIEITDSIHFQPYGFVDAFAPQYTCYLTGAATFTNGSTSVVSTQGSFGEDIVGKYVRAASAAPQANMLVAAISQDGLELTLAAPYVGATTTAATYWSQHATGTFPSGTKIPLGDPVIYKTFTDYQNDAARAYPVYPAMGGNGWRGAPQPIIILDWDYVTATPLSSAAGMEVRIFLAHDAPFGGWYGTATFYCTVESEG
jgi:hypothetical protein